MRYFYVKTDDIDRLIQAMEELNKEYVLVKNPGMVVNKKTFKRISLPDFMARGEAEFYWVALPSGCRIQAEPPGFVPESDALSL